ncbi:TPA: nucleoside triphosphate hydrolase [Candidatus Acetothermia bacterium]|nr:nucleoside triphosphate hydrolase [Candidatus Acetothermia bacterium]
MGRIGEAVEALAAVIARLRGPGGCPWDRAQTHASLAPYLLEEAYEAAAALEAGDPDRLKEELGDLLLQVALHAQIESEAGRFDLADVADFLREKLIRRHPHVFAEGTAARTPAEVRERWEELKRKEGKGLELALPALVAARKRIQARGAGQGLHPYLSPPEGPPPDPEGELGRLLFAVCSLAHCWGVEPELALKRHLERLEGGG